MFTPASNGIPASDKYVSSTPVVLDAGLNDQLRNTQIRKLDGQKKRKPKKMSHFPEIKNRHDDLVASVEYARVNESIIYATTHEEKSLINVLSSSKTPKMQQVEGFTHM